MMHAREPVLYCLCLDILAFDEFVSFHVRIFITAHCMPYQCQLHVACMYSFFAPRFCHMTLFRLLREKNLLQALVS